MPKNTFIELDNVFKSYKNFDAVNGLSFKVLEGDIFGFLGPNGSGKSTTIRMILSLIKPTSGNIKLFGNDLNENKFESLSQIGSLIEKPDFYGYITARKNLEILGQISSVKNLNSKIDEVLNLVGLKEREHSKVKTYSQGMKQRLGIAQTLLHNPKLIILDEPANGLDPQGQREMRQLIKTINKEKQITIVISSHILAEIEQLATRMVIINKGKNVAEGRVDKLLNKSNINVTIKTGDNKNATQLLNNSGWKDKVTDANSERILVNISKSELAKLNKHLVHNGIDVYSIESARSLEEFFIDMTENVKIN